MTNKKKSKYKPRVKKYPKESPPAPQKNGPMLEDGTMGLETIFENEVFQVKRGVLSKTDKEYIANNYTTMSMGEMARHIRKNPKLIQEHIDFLEPPESTHTIVAPSDKDKYTRELRDTQAWKNLRKEFEQVEILFFEEKYVSYRDQFKEDVTASEDSQIFDLIKIEILIHRNLVKQKVYIKQLDSLESDRIKLLNQMTEPGYTVQPSDKNKLIDIDTLIQSSGDRQNMLISQHTKHSSSAQDILKSLKSTREQRVTRMENNKRSFIDLIRELIDQEAREKSDRQVDQMKKAADKEYGRLGSLHTYMDGQQDRPIFNADTVMREED